MSEECDHCWHEVGATKITKPKYGTKFAHWLEVCCKCHAYRTETEYEV